MSKDVVNSVEGKVEETANTNVVKTTEDVNVTVDNVKNIVNGGGIVVAAETVKKSFTKQNITSIVLGIIVAVAGAIGINKVQVDQQKQRFINIKNATNEAIAAIKSGDNKVATEKLQFVLTTANEIVEDVKTVVKEQKNEQKEPVVTDEKKVEELVKTEVKKVSVKGKPKVKAADVKKK